MIAISRRQEIRTVNTAAHPVQASLTGFVFKC